MNAYPKIPNSQNRCPEIPEDIDNSERAKNAIPDQNRLKDDQAVILIHGNNMFGDEVYSYVLFTLTEFRRMRNDLALGINMTPSDYGSVIESGKGSPSSELKIRMRIEYGLVDIENSKKETKHFGRDSEKSLDLKNLKPMEGLNIELSKKLKLLGSTIDLSES